MYSIQVNGLSKKYRLGLTHRGSLRELCDATFRRLSPRRRQTAVGPSGEFWALKDVSFEVAPGEVLGIIGKNGAGKSTVLKVLSRITVPTQGKVRMRGRVASLLEVGTGFHPELTGRENVFLNGAILGMTRTEVRKKFDAIAAFSGIESFLDTPVKRYSSGMYTRLAFAVAAHLEPEILVVDEVLAVGDAEFQRRCLSRMDEVARSGRTVLFVSHNMNAIDDLCGRALLLVDGQIAAESNDVRTVITRYLGIGVEESAFAIWNNPGDDFANPFFQPTRMSLCDGGGQPVPIPMRNDTDVRLRLEGVCERASPKGDLTICYSIFDQRGALVYSSCMTDVAFDEWPTLNSGTTMLETPLPSRLLNEGVYYLNLAVRTMGGTYVCNSASTPPSIRFEIQGGLSDSPRWRHRRPGVIAPVIPWSVLN